MLVIFGLLVLVAAGYWLWRSRLVSPPPRIALAPVSFAALPGWEGTDARPALAAFRRSCAVLSPLSKTEPMAGAGYAGAVSDWLPACSAAPSAAMTMAEARAWFATWFTPVEIRGSAEALFTGYYEPEIHGSARRHDDFTTPVYGLPDDLIEVNLGLFKSTLSGEHIAGRVVRQSLVPYFTRSEIDTHGLAHAPVLLYADDPVSVFFLHIQGSGRASMDDGEAVRLAYAGQNGRPYIAIGRVLIANGTVDRAHMSMQAIRAWLDAHPADARALMEHDQSFVFFREAPLGDPALGSPGSEGVPLAPGASIAVDPHLNPLGAPFFIAATAPDPDPAKPDVTLNRLFIAQDTGGAIKGGARADVFWGFGTAAESVAGRMKSTGRMFVLLPRPLATKLAQ